MKCFCNYFSFMLDCSFVSLFTYFLKRIFFISGSYMVNLYRWREVMVLGMKEEWEHSCKIRVFQI